MSASAPGFPLRLDGAGATARAPSRAAAAEQLVEELLFTALGERLNRPQLGCGLLELVFDPATEALRAATQFQVAAELQRWLGDVIRVLEVVVESGDGRTTVNMTYALTPETALRTVVFRR
jgi:phage baseplate assembly protein W